MRACVRACVRGWVRTYVPACVRARVCVCLYVRVCACILCERANIYSNINTYVCISLIMYNVRLESGVRIVKSF